MQNGWLRTAITSCPFEQKLKSYTSIYFSVFLCTNYVLAYSPLTPGFLLLLTLPCSLPAGASICWVAINGSVAGYLALADSPRPDAAAAVQLLQSCGVVVAMLTGDNPGAAAAAAAAVGLEGEHVHASLLPQDKFDAVSLGCILASRGTSVGSPCKYSCRGWA